MIHGNHPDRLHHHETRLTRLSRGKSCLGIHPCLLQNRGLHQSHDHHPGLLLEDLPSARLFLFPLELLVHPRDHVLKKYEPGTIPRFKKIIRTCNTYKIYEQNLEEKKKPKYLQELLV